MSENIFLDKDLMVVLTTAPAGLGHVRVTEALRAGLPEEVDVEMMGLSHPTLQVLHRISSRTTLLRGLMEFTQSNPLVEGYFTRFYRKRLRRHSDEAYQRLSDLISRRRPKPKLVLVVSTHHSLAHQLAGIKNKIIKEYKVKLVLAVVVTDDSPQKIWGVKDSDFLFVPSGSTRDRLLEYMQTFKGQMPEVVVIPYPMSPKFCQLLKPQEFEEKLRQVKPGGKAKMKIMIPISGAAVQLKYFEDLIEVLVRSKNAEIIVVSRDSKHTERFLRWCQKKDFVEVLAEKYDREVVEIYERQYLERVIALEITKPSEQAFKVLLEPRQRAGALMMFSHPVGRQEYDNVRFMLRHGLLPGEQEDPFEPDLQDIKWRGLRLSRDGKEAGRQILKWRKSGVLEKMMQISQLGDKEELSCHGTDLLWARLGVELRKSDFT